MISIASIIAAVIRIGIPFLTIFGFVYIFLYYCFGIALFDDHAEQNKDNSSSNENG